MIEQEEKTDKLSFKLSEIYNNKMTFAECNPEFMRKFEAGLPTNTVDIEFDVPDLSYNTRDCPYCNSTKTLKRIPINEQFVRGLFGNFIVQIESLKGKVGKMAKKTNVDKLNFIWACDNCCYAETEYKDFVPDINKAIIEQKKEEPEKEEIDDLEEVEKQIEKYEDTNKDKWVSL